MLGCEPDDKIPMTGRRRSRNQTAIGRYRKGFDRPLNFARVAHLIGFTSTLCDGAAAWMTPNWPAPWLWRIAKDRRARHAGRDLLEQLQPFPAKLYSNAPKP